MATKAETLPIRDLYTGDERSYEVFLEGRRRIFTSLDERREALELLESWPAGAKGGPRAAAHKGILLWTLGRVEEALEAFEGIPPTKESVYFQACAWLDAGLYETATELARKAAEMLPENFAPLGCLTEALVASGRGEEAVERLAKAAARFSSSPDFHCAMGTALDACGRYAEAEAEYERALGVDGLHPGALFRKAWNLALRGNDDEALTLYERLRTVRPPHVGSLLNLGILYEDRSRYQDAAGCYRQILDAYPGQTRATLYLRDANAALNMYYDEEIRRRESGWKRVMGTPVAELPFSVRTRNVLAKTGMTTLGDILKKTPAELTSMKTLGAAGVAEIAEYLQSRGLTLATVSSAEAGEASAVSEQLLARHLDEFEWSARARKAIEGLGMQNLGDLVSRSEKELLAVKNFGQTSLNEVRQKLAAMGLTLRAEG